MLLKRCLLAAMAATVTVDAALAPLGGLLANLDMQVPDGWTSFKNSDVISIRPALDKAVDATKDASKKLFTATKTTTVMAKNSYDSTIDVSTVAAKASVDVAQYTIQKSKEVNAETAAIVCASMSYEYMMDSTKALADRLNLPETKVFQYDCIPAEVSNKVQTFYRKSVNAGKNLLYQIKEIPSTLQAGFPTADKAVGCFTTESEGGIKGIMGSTFQVEGDRAQDLVNCMDMCKTLGFQMAGTGPACFCGDAAAQALKVLDSACDNKCEGSLLACGGQYAASLYKTVDVATEKLIVAGSPYVDAMKAMTDNTVTKVTTAVTNTTNAVVDTVQQVAASVPGTKVDTIAIIQDVAADIKATTKNVTTKVVEKLTPQGEAEPSTSPAPSSASSSMVVAALASMAVAYLFSF